MIIIILCNITYIIYFIFIVNRLFNFFVNYVVWKSVVDKGFFWYLLIHYEISYWMKRFVLRDLTDFLW